ncbi:TadE/TadG family type IV pilus assembly protein [Ruegeria sp. MALMAid1280]|uniref:TadE/TadG family type IV pilus assembly protein n=1 Tax=Ruegeria sp. MALMAid1280 TaxID=3411634 RepID=UPI003BA392B0
MTRYFLSFRQFLARFARSEHGGLAFEGIVVFPIFVWSITLGYTFFDGFRQNTANLKAAYTVGDLISRETDELTDTYAQSMYTVMRRMVNNNSTLKMRLSFIMYQEDDDRHYVHWSTTCGFVGTWDNSNIDRIKENLPPMADLDTLILVETLNDYNPLFKTGWLTKDHEFTNFVFTRPRFTDLVKAPDISPIFCQGDAGPVDVAPTS